MIDGGVPVVQVSQAEYDECCPRAVHEAGNGCRFRGPFRLARACTYFLQCTSQQTEACGFAHSFRELHPHSAANEMLVGGGVSGGSPCAHAVPRHG